MKRPLRRGELDPSAIRDIIYGREHTIDRMTTAMVIAELSDWRENRAAQKLDVRLLEEAIRHLRAMKEFLRSNGRADRHQQEGSHDD